jgi:CubicO group peptidase (beta-lactamase class C family)
LAEDGLITWDTTPVDVWPELGSNIHAGFRNATLRQFLAHTTGIRRDDDYGPASDGAVGTLMQKRSTWAEHLLTQAPEFPIDPGDPDANIPAAVGPAGNVHVTLNGYAQFMLAQLAGARGAPGLVTTASFATLHTAVASDYALGWETPPTMQTLGVSAIGHTGSTGRWFSLVWLAPSIDTGLMIVANGGGERASAAIQALDLRIRERVVATP